MQIDCDIKLLPDFNYIDLQPDFIYVSKTHKEIKSNIGKSAHEQIREQCGTAGTCLMHKDKVFKYGGYNEACIENCLFDTLYLNNYLLKEFKNIKYFKDMLEHIHHDKASRLKNMKIKSFKEAMKFNSVNIKKKGAVTKNAYKVNKDGTLQFT